MRFDAGVGGGVAVGAGGAGALVAGGAADGDAAPGGTWAIVPERLSCCTIASYGAVASSRVNYLL